jgi:ribose transport system permease protein
MNSPVVEAPPDKVTDRSPQLRRESRWLGIRKLGAVWPATALLFILSPVVAPGSLGASAMLSMLPFAAVLALVAMGQALVVQQRGLDLSVAGSISLAAVLVTKVANQDDSKVPLALLVALLAVAVGGALSGLAVTKLGITPIVATLGVNALMLGAVESYSGGFPTGAAESLNTLALGRTLGLPNTLIVAIIVLSLMGVAASRTLLGRRLAQVGTSPTALRLVGGRPALLVVSAYVLAGLFYGCAGIILAAYTQTPGIFVGDSYLLPSVAAVVLAGNSLTGGQLKVAAIGLSALFLTQLDQLVLSLGAPNSVQLLIQSGVLVVAVSGHLLARWRPGRRKPRLATDTSVTAAQTAAASHTLN